MRNVCLLPSHLGDFQTIWKAFLRVISGNNNPITSCICQVKSLVCVSKGQKRCLNVFHLSEETQHPWSSVGTEESTLWHNKVCGGTATCHIWADFAGCCRFQVLLVSGAALSFGMHSHPAAPLECPGAASALCQHAQPRGSSPQLPARPVTVGATAQDPFLICPLHSVLCASWWAVCARALFPDPLSL